MRAAVLLNTICLVYTGEQLTTAWGSILELLSVVPQAEEAETVNLAFQSVQLLCSDYMSSLPVHHLRRCVEVAALYGSQQVGATLHAHVGSDYPLQGLCLFEVVTLIMHHRYAGENEYQRILSRNRTGHHVFVLTMQSQHDLP